MTAVDDARAQLLAALLVERFAITPRAPRQPARPELALGATRLWLAALEARQTDHFGEGRRATRKHLTDATKSRRTA